MNHVTKALIVAAALFGGAACGAPDPSDGAKHGFKVDVVVTSDPGHGTAGAVLASGEQTLATTDASGHARLWLLGLEGDHVEIAVRCPEGFESPHEALGISLRRFSSDSRVPSFVARCAPLARTVVVGIRTENGADLPVFYLGKEIGRTDTWGAAHVVLSVKANESITLKLDTTSRTDGKPRRLRPENPTLTFVAKDQDDFVTLEQRFEVERPVVRKAGPARGGPTRI